MTNTVFRPAVDPSDTTRAGATILIEPRSLTRQCLTAWLEQHEPGLKLRALGTPEAAADHGDGDVELVVWSIGASSITSSQTRAALEQLKQCFPEAPLALLADREETEDVREALQLGVKGYVPTSLDRRDVLEVLRFVRAGGTYVPASALVDAEEQAASHPEPCSDRRAETTFDDLTPREADVVERLRQGKPNKVIAHELEISESTVKVFVHRILHKLGAVNRTEVAYLAQQWANRPATRSDTLA